MWTINLCQLDWTFSHMFRQWTWNLDRTAAVSFITLVLWPLSWTIIKKKKGTNISSRKPPRRAEVCQKLLIFYPGGPKYIKNMYFRPLVPPTFELSRGKLGQSNPKMPPELRNTASWEALHKRTTTSDQYRQRNQQFTTPLSKWIQLRTDYHWQYQERHWIHAQWPVNSKERSY